jgi:hypothetical protein
MPTDESGSTENGDHATFHDVLPVDSAAPDRMIGCSERVKLTGFRSA